MHDPIGTAQLRGFWVWLLGGGLATCAVLFLLGGDRRSEGLYALGAVFALTAFLHAVLARRAGIGAVVVVAWGLGFGYWFPEWVDTLGPITRHWVSELGHNDPQLASRLVGPASIAGAGATTGVILYLLTRSWRVVLQTCLLSLVVAATPLLSSHGEGAVMAGVIAWHIAVSGSLFRWMMGCVRGRAGLACPGCGFDIVGLSSPVCPGCGGSLVRRDLLPAPSRAPSRLASAGR